MNIIRYVFIVTLLLTLCLPVANAKHIIVVYDVSRSMYTLNVAAGPSTRMESEDIQRVNNYLTDIIFRNASQSLRDSDDSHIRNCDPAYVGQPLYQRGDIITYAEYADRRYPKLNRQQVHRDEFQARLPDPMNLRRSFFGQVSYLLQAKVEVYEELFSESDGETYWIFVTDGDVARSAENDPNYSNVLQRHTSIEERYDDPMIVGILVNEHVRIEVRRIQLISEVMFIANTVTPNKLVKEIILKKDRFGQFYSEPLIIDTNVSNRTRYKLNSVNVEVFDRNGNPLRIVNDDSGVSTHTLTPVLLRGKVPPAKFRIPLPVNAEITDSGKLQLKVNYSFEGIDDTYTLYTEYEPVDSNIYISNLDNSKPIEKVILRLSDDSYRAILVVRTESSNKTPFRIDNIRCRILYEDNRQLCEGSIATIPSNLDEQFEIVVPKEKDLKKYGNKFVLDIDYHYNQTAESETFQTLFDTRGDTSGVLSIILIIIVAIVIIIGLVYAIGLIWKWIKGSDISYKIKLQIDGEEAKTFPLTNGTAVSFGQTGDSEYSFDAGSSARISCQKGKLLFHKDLYDEDGSELTSNQLLEIPTGDGEQIDVHFEFVKTASDQPQEVDSKIDDPYGDDLLPP